MLLNKLLADFVDQIKLDNKIEVTNLCLDSRHIKTGDLFFALPGTQTNGEEFIIQAINAGAVAVVKQGVESTVTYQNQIPIISIADLTKQLGNIAAKFYANPSRELTVIGITGTNGKTSCCYFLAQALQQLNEKPAIIGTLGYGAIDELQSFGMTTPDAITLQRIIAELKQQGFTTIVMEVSSHALAQYRVDGVELDCVVFTNLTQDHLDYHQTMEAYAKAKRRLASWPTVKTFVLNEEDQESKAWLQEISADKKVCLYAKHVVAAKKYQYCYAEDIQLSMQGLVFNLESTWGDIKVHNDLLGSFNVDNLLAVISVLGMLGFEFPKIIASLQNLKPVPGRMQLIREPNKPLVVIDFAHTPDALEQVLQALKPVCKGLLSCVFGCGGDRDKAKRPLMAAVSEIYADKIYLTNDNPRNEASEQIVEDIMQGIKDKEKIIIELDRLTAIKKAITAAKENDMVLIAGKGHETEQLIAGKKLHFNDVEAARKVLRQEY